MYKRKIIVLSTLAIITNSSVTAYLFSQICLANELLAVYDRIPIIVTIAYTEEEQEQFANLNEEIELAFSARSIARLELAIQELQEFDLLIHKRMIEESWQNLYQERVTALEIIELHELATVEERRVFLDKKDEIHQMIEKREIIREIISETLALSTLVSTINQVYWQQITAEPLADWIDVETDEYSDDDNVFVELDFAEENDELTDYELEYLS